MNYPKQHEQLLRKAGLIGHGIVEVRVIHEIRSKSVSEDGNQWENRKVPTESRITKSSTSLIYDQSGRIEGYWANGLTNEEKMTIHQDCGVPLFYLGEPEDPATGLPKIKDTRITILEGELLNLENPADMAKLMVLIPIVSMIGATRQEAQDNGAFFYFQSVEEEANNQHKLIATKKDVVKYIDTLSRERKQQIVKILVFEGILPVDYNLSLAASEIVFDEAAFDIPQDVIDAFNIIYPDEHVVIYTLMSSGHIEATDWKDGPFYKNPDFYGQRSHLADTLAEMKKKIHTYPDLLKAYKDLSAIVSGEVSDKLVQRNNKNVLELLNRHVTRHDVEEGPDEYTVRKNKVQMLKKQDVIALLDSEGIDHVFTDKDDIKTIKEFYVNLKAEV